MRPPLQPIAPHIEDPIALLLACHDKVRRFATLSVRVRDHVELAGPDEQAGEAAASILRYFDVAAPLHHDDEELDLFPALRSLGDAATNAHMDSLQAEHGQLSRLWLAIRPWLQATAAGQPHPGPTQVDNFARSYTAHARREETEVYPLATHLSHAQVAALSKAMVARRTHTSAEAPAHKHPGSAPAGA